MPRKEKRFTEERIKSIRLQDEREFGRIKKGNKKYLLSLETDKLIKKYKRGALQ